MSALSERKPVREFGETVSRQEETTIKKLQLIIVAHSLLNCSKRTIKMIKFAIVVSLYSIVS